MKKILFSIIVTSIIGILLVLIYQIYTQKNRLDKIELEKKINDLCGTAKWYEERAPEWWLEQTKQRYEQSLDVTDTYYFIKKVYNDSNWAENNCLKSSDQNLIDCFNKSNVFTAEEAFNNWKTRQKQDYEKAQKQLEEYKRAKEKCEEIKQN